MGLERNINYIILVTVPLYAITPSDFLPVRFSFKYYLNTPHFVYCILSRVASLVSFLISQCFLIIIVVWVYSYYRSPSCILLLSLTQVSFIVSYSNAVDSLNASFLSLVLCFLSPMIIASSFTLIFSDQYNRKQMSFNTHILLSRR